MFMDIPCSPELAAQYAHVQQQWEAKKRQASDETRAAMQLYIGKPTEHHRKGVLQAIKTCSLYEGSATRLSVVLVEQQFQRKPITNSDRCRAVWLGRGGGALTGQMGNVRLSPEAEAYFAKKGCKVFLQPTPEAQDKFNRSHAKKIGLFHVTC